MEKTVLLLAIVFGSILRLCYTSNDPVEVFYVQPTGPTTECPSGDSPCHSLQYYANHSNFTNNSRFLFLEGEHHLDSLVAIRNVANLSLVGVSSGVKILCKSVVAGFHVREFTGLNIENVAISNCNGATLSLASGSEVSLSHITISNSFGQDAAGISASNIVGSFSTRNSTFITGSTILAEYTQCNRPSDFKFSNNKLTQLQMEICCSNVQILLTNSNFENEDFFINGMDIPLIGLEISLYELINNSVLVKNNTFRRASISIEVSSDSLCDKNSSLMKLTGVTTNSPAYFDFGDYFTECCIIEIEDSQFSDSISSKLTHQLIFDFSGSRENATDTSVQAILYNVTIVNITHHPVSYFDNVALLFVNCVFENNVQSAVQSFGSKLTFQGNNIFRNNSALVGGGIQLLLSSYMYLQANTSILFENNHADYVGGAIYTDYADQDPCVFGIDSSNQNTIDINFVKNSAKLSGSSLYGGGLKTCVFFSQVFNISNTEADPSAIASVPYNVCLCDDGKHQPNCSSFYRDYSTDAYPGQEFPIRLAVVGASFDGVVPGAVRAYFNSSHSALGNFQTTQTSDKPTCENFYYSVNSTNKTVILLLTAEQSFLKSITTRYLSLVISVTVYLKDCPQNLGFSLSLDTHTCVCDPVLDSNNVECYINNQSLLRGGSSWIGYTETSDENITGVMFHPNCPIGYCLPHDVSITSNTSDSQCEPHRTGLLCGECEDGYSLTLGNGRCVECSNTYLLLILPLAVAGLLLVAFLFALNLTVTEGSINGLIFYANVIGMNHNVLFSEEASYLYTFLAWLNLDLGISTCLFDGMDGYAETWLQFVFPIYLWVIILAIVQFYRKFPTLAGRLGGENAVKVLATLLLLSYTKLQRTIVTIMSFTKLEYPDGVVHYVWLYNANLEFFKGKHLYLGIAGILVLVFLIVPYTLCLAFFQQLQACSGHRLFQWVNKLKPVFDSYAGPYKDKYRFWTGMLLVVRTLLIILFTINTTGSLDINLLIISVVSFALLMGHSNGIYKKWPYNYLESFFYLQLGVFAAGVAYVRLSHDSVTAVANTSIGLTLTVFLAVVGYHVLNQVTCLKRHYYRMRGFANMEEDMLINHERE